MFVLFNEPPKTSEEPFAYSTLTIPIHKCHASMLTFEYLHCKFRRIRYMMVLDYSVIFLNHLHQTSLEHCIVVPCFSPHLRVFSSSRHTPSSSYVETQALGGYIRIGETFSCFHTAKIKLLFLILLDGFCMVAARTHPAQCTCYVFLLIHLSSTSTLHCLSSTIT